MRLPVKFISAVFAASCATASFAQDLPKIAFVYISPAEDDVGWTHEHDKGRLAVEAEFGDKVDPAEVAKVQGLIDEVKAAIKGDNKELIETKSQELMEASGALAQAQAGAAGEAPEGAQASDKKPVDDDVVDAEFEEVDDTKK